MNPLDFLLRHAPFDRLSDAGRRRVDRALEITWAQAGDAIGDGDGYLWVLRKGRVRLELGGLRVAELGPGEIFGLTSLAEGGDADGAGADPRFAVTAERDCLLYRLPAGIVRALAEDEPSFGRYFFDRLAARLRSLADAQSVTFTSDLGARVGDLARRRPVTLGLDADPTLRDAARTMEREAVSSVLLTGAADPTNAADEMGEPVGIVTDRDLRRAVAEGRGPETPVADVMTTPVERTDPDVPGAEALLRLLRSGRHHLVLAGDDGRATGVVTHSDLLRRHLQSPAALLEWIRAAETPVDLAGYDERVAATVETLHGSGVEATDAGRIVAALGDAVASRLLELAEAELGPPPAEYAWIVFGSEGRQEQSFLTDQDNALVHGEMADDGYFAELAESVVGGLVTAGFPPCEGGFMATEWRLPLGEWEARFRRWIDEPEPENLLRVANLFDWRVVLGGLDLEPLEQVVREGRRTRRFLGQLARASMEKRPPLGILRRIQEEEGGVDLKAGALMPISGLARLFALEAGKRRGSTLRRLRRAARAGTVSEEGAELLVEAFRFAFGLRLRHQLQERREGREITNRVRLDELTPGERRHLKEAFVEIDRVQRATEQRFETGLLG